MATTGGHYIECLQDFFVGQAVTMKCSAVLVVCCNNFSYIKAFFLLAKYICVVFFIPLSITYCVLIGVDYQRDYCNERK